MKQLLREKESVKLLVGFIFVGISIFILVGLYLPVSTGSRWSYLRKLTVASQIIATLSHNNSSSRTGSNLEGNGKSFIVNTPTCKIPDFDPWDEDVNLLKKKCWWYDEADPKCETRGGGRNWVYAQGSKLILNHSALHESGYSKSSLRCCYHVIHRVEQSLQQFNSSADEVVHISDQCRPFSLENNTEVDAEFVRVFCVSNAWPLLNDVVYREYFALAQPDTHAQKKISKWKTHPDEDIPPSIVMLGIDSNSRLNSHRQMTRTLKVLQTLEAVELLGYTKVGENTFSNTVPFLAGMTHNDLLWQCYSNENGSFDGCPFIWKDFDRAGYLTATAEEAPLATGFNYYRNGFVHKPVDFYYRPFTLASVLRQAGRSGRNVKCVGHHSSMELLLSYLDDILRWGSHGAPVFIHSWVTSYSHECINSVRFVDAAVANFISAVDKLNTVLLVMSDHGDRHGAFRESTLGWYEDKLPSMWIYLPEKVRKRWPQWQSNLQLNAVRLTSHFDLYQTFVHILHSYKVDPDFRVNTPTPVRGQSLLELVPENRTCNQASIPGAYCACSEPKPINLNNLDKRVETLIRQAANATISYLESVVPPECAKMTVTKIVSAKRMQFPDGEDIYVVSFYTDPGEFLFEVTSTARKLPEGEEGEDSRSFSVDSLDSILRMNKITREVTCIRDPVLERYCYCV